MLDNLIAEPAQQFRAAAFGVAENLIHDPARRNGAKFIQGRCQLGPGQFRFTFKLLC